MVRPLDNNELWGTEDPPSAVPPPEVIERILADPVIERDFPEVYMLAKRLKELLQG